MQTTTYVRVFAFTAIACLLTVPLNAQQPIPLELPEAARYREALSRHPLLTSADARVRAAEARVGSARALRPPAALFMDAEELALGDPGGANLTAGLERDFIPGAERRALAALAEADYASVVAERDGLKLYLESRINRAFLEAAVHHRIAERLAEEDTLLHRAEATLNARFAVGQARYVDVIRLRTERLRVQADVLDARAQLASALLELAALSGGIEAPILRALPLPMPRMPTNIDSLMQQSPALRIAAVEQQRARATLLSTSGSAARRVTARLGVQRFAGEGGGSTIGPVLGAAVSLPSTNRRSVQLAMEAASQDTLAAVARVRAVQNTLLTEINTALQRISAVAERIAGVDQQLINAAREEREAALSAYANGELTLMELLDFERSLSRSEIQLLQSYDAAITAYDRVNQLLAGRDATTGDAH